MRWIIERLFGWDEVREDKNLCSVLQTRRSQDYGFKPATV